MAGIIDEGHLWWRAVLSHCGTAIAMARKLRGALQDSR
jgi:hypothetical protein